MLNKLLKKISLPRAAEQTWKTKDGKVLKISEMEDKHLLNVQKIMSDRILLYAVISKEVDRRKLKPKLSKIRKITNINLDQWEEDMLRGIDSEDCF